MANLSNIITPTNIVTNDGTATLENKTISGANNTVTGLPLSTAVTGTLPVTNGGTGATALTGVLKGNGTGAVTASDVNLASEVTGVLAPANGGTGLSDPGTSGNVLTSTGTAWTSAAPSPPPLSAYTLVSETNVSGANTVDFNNLPDEYNGGYMLVLDDVSPSSDNQQLHANYFQNGVLYTGNAIRFSFAELTDNFGFFDGSNENHVRLTGYNRSVTNAFASAGVCGTINFKIQTNTNNPITSDLNYQNVTGHRIISQSFLQISSYFELSGIRLRWHQGGTFASGVIRLYGVNL